MKASEVLKLIDQGFTADEIRSMEDPAQAADPEPAPAADPEPAPAKKTAAEQFTDLFNGLTAKVDQLTKAVQAANTRTATGGKPEAAETVEDIINGLFAETEDK